MEKMECSYARVLLILTALIGLNDYPTIGSEHVFGKCYGRGIDARTPKKENLTGICSPWKSDSCCSKEEASVIDDMYAENYCASQMSPQCKERFQQVNCFRKCSPNLGLWVINKTNTNPSFQFVPIAQSECKSWWENCKNELTCFENRTANLHWEDKLGICTKKENCKPIKDIYADATFFCEHVLGPFDFLVVKEEEPSMTIFGDTRENELAEKYIEQTMKESGKDRLYEIVYTPPKNRNGAPDPLQLKKKEEWGDTQKVQFIMLSFFLGGLTTVIGIVAGCCILSKWRLSMRRTTSLQHLCSSNGNANGETGFS